MKVTIKILFFTIFLVSSCQSDREGLMKFINPLDSQRENEIISLTLDELETFTGEFVENKRPLFVSGADTLITQFINYQGDDLPEEILIEISIPANDFREVRVEWIEKESYPDFPAKTNLHFALHQDPGKDLDSANRLPSVKTEVTSEVFQMEGPAWENEKVGFRNYFDLRNGMDIFGKTTSEMVLNYVGLKKDVEKPRHFNFDTSYHEMSNWGMDILKVGNSLGAGAVALQIKDSLYRIGDNGRGTYEKLYEGPLKSEFRLRYPDWEAAGKVRDIIQDISIEAGKYCYRSSLFSKDVESNVSFVTGIVNTYSEEFIKYEAGENHIAFLTHSRQAEDGNFLTMAILVKKEDFAGTDETQNTREGITETFYVKLNTKTGKTTNYRFYAFWATENPDIRDLNTVKSILNRDALEIENPIKVE